jgi:lysozyme
MYGDQLRLPNVRTGTYTGMIRDDYQLKPEDNRVWSKEELVEIFKNDLETFERGVLRLVPSVVGRQGAFDALVSFAFNAGLGNVQRSTIRMRANRGDWEGAAAAFRMWTKGGGKVLPGLVRRREAEIALFLS